MSVLIPAQVHVYTERAKRDGERLPYWPLQFLLAFPVVRGLGQESGDPTTQLIILVDAEKATHLSQLITYSPDNN